MGSGQKRLLILGSGFSSFSLLKTIDAQKFEVTVVSPRNHFLFTPLLPSTTVGTIEFRSVVEPVRQAKRGTIFYEAACTKIDSRRRAVACKGSDSAFTLAYDALVIGVGAGVNTYGIPGVVKHALFLKEIADARAIRQRIIECCERASRPDIDDTERRRLLHFVVVGGGPTGVEFAAEMHDLLREDLSRAYPLLWNDVRITLLEAGSSILTTFDATLSAYTERLFRRQRIEVRTRTPVARLGSDHVTLKNGERVPYGLLVWSTGVVPRLLTKTCSFQKDSLGRIVTDDRLRVVGRHDVYAFGDCATIGDLSLPMTAQVAQQQGHYLGIALNQRASGKEPRPFRYRHYGMLAYIGGNKALADLEKSKTGGFATFLFWRSVYLTRLMGIKNKMLVMFDWFKTLVFGRDISRF
ncbi:MAG: hypothetical protein A3H45_13775 [Ignavibacteria bacterium RIFCSPLOWO2_02_FULL_55_14]|nr:MAG: hypothetical protein A3H45_13775 [Ignavibacteria bacterium RIFCSPLOWO2_02_FULL_55_14]